LFSLLHAFDIGLEVSVPGDHIRTRSFYPEEILDILRFEEPFLLGMNNSG
jgi:hypothetical protein